MRIDSVHLDREVERDVGAGRTVERLQKGELLFVRNCLQEFQVFDALQNMLRRVLCDLAGRDAAALLEKRGIEKIHEIIDVDQVEQVYIECRKVLREKMPAFTAQMFRRLGVADPFYVHDASLLRLMLPYELMNTRKAEFKKHLGKLSLHGPHHDHYQNVPLNAINTWISLGRVRPENGMFIFPDVWGRNLPRGAEVVRSDQYLGEPVAIEMAPGDALLFHSNHMHSSVLNTTDETRAVLTNRICLAPPLYPNPDRPHRYFHSDAFPADFAGEELFTERGFVGREDRLLDAGAAPGTMSDSTTVFPHEKRADTPITKKIEAYADPASDAPEGEIIALDKASCGVRMHGEFLTFRRYCSHEGADLSLGFVRNGKIVCPFHGVQFCPRTGQSNCSAIRDIKLLH